MKIVKSSCSSKRKVRTCTFSPQVNIKNKRTAVQTEQDVNAAHSEAKLQDLINDIKSNIYTKVKAVATSPEFGFDENEVDDYFFVEASATEIGEDHHEAIRVEVRGEVSYEGLEDLMEALNPIIESYDSYAYFEPVEPGIIEAYVSVNQIDMSIYGATASPDHMFYDYHGKRFSVHDNSSEIGEDSIDDVYFLWKGSISQQAGAYNDADEDYVYAFIRGRGIIEYYKKGKYVATDNYILRDEDDFEYAWEYMEIILQHICDRLIAYNKDVPDRMVYNSTSIQAADDEFHGYADVASDSGQSVEATEDLTDLPENFQHAYTLAKNDFMNDYSSSGVEVYVVPDDFNAEDGEICLIVKGINRVGRLTQGKVYVYLDEEDPDVIYTALEETADALSIEPGSSDIEMSTCSDNIEASAQDIWVQDANGYVICRTNVSGRNAGWPSYYDRTDGKFTLGWVVDIDCMYDTYEEAAKDLEQLKARIKREYEEDPSPRKSKVALRADYTILEVIDGEIQSDRPGNPDIIVDWRRENASSNVTSSTDDKVFIEDIIDGLEDNGYDLSRIRSIRQGLLELFGYKGKDADIIIHDMIAGRFIDPNDWVDKDYTPGIYSATEEDDGEGYWFFTTHGVQPGSVPRDVDILDIIDTPNGSFVKFDRFLSTEELNEYDMVEKSPKSVMSSKNCEYVKSSEEDEDEEDLPMVDQEYDSAATSINSNKLPAIYRMINLEPGKLYLDFGGGKFDNGIEYVKDKGATLVVYDPYNRSAEHNKEVLRILRENGGADAAINSNVLNVIKEPEARKNVLENIARITKPGAPIYITVYEGKGNGQEGPTKSGYQLNRKTADYLEEIQEVFPDATRRGKLITAHNSGSVSSSTNVEGYTDEQDIYRYDKDVVSYRKIISKSVEDSDDFLTDYTMYEVVTEDGSVEYECYFGDNDMYGPWNGEGLDFSSEDYDEAVEWYNSYSSDEIEASEPVEGDAFSQLEDAYLSSPEYDDPIEHEDSQELIEVELDQVITVDVDGDYEWDDDTYVWASPDGSNEEWRSEDGVYIDDKVGVVEHIDDLIIPNVPTRPGKYRVTGLAKLIYDVSGIQEYRTNYGPDDYESDLDTDHAAVSFNFSKSSVENLKITPVRR